MIGNAELQGRRFARWTAVRQIDSTKWEFRCDCGTVKTVLVANVKRGVSRSCGCLQRELRKWQCRHGMAGTRIYKIWDGMLNRCLRPTCISFKHYGGRGIKVCEAWRSFAGFFTDMGPFYFEGASLDRINNDSDYSKANCRWVNWDEQCCNKRTSRHVEAFGEKKTISQWASDTRCKVSGRRLGIRLRYSWGAEEAISTPIGGRK